MKKFLRYLIVIVLVLASIGGTCYFFFKTLTKRKDSETYVTDYLFSSARVEFDGKVSLLQTNTDTRFDSLAVVKGNFDDILSTFSTYLINVSSYDVDENGIVQRLNDYLSKQSEVEEMIDSFLNRLSSDSFNRVTGANEIYQQFANMNLLYADLLDYINSELDNMPIEKNSDLKFSMIDLYIKVVNLTLEDMTTTTGGELQMSDSSNLAVMNTYFKLENSMLITGSDTTYFESLNNSFIKLYASESESFAKNLASVLNTVNSYSEDLTDVLKLAYYFKAIYRITN